PLEKRYVLLERGDAFESELFHIARHLVRMKDELAKDNAVRLPEYSDARLASLKLRVFSPAPIHPELERVKLAGSLTFLTEPLGVGGLVAKVLDGKSPADRAAELIAGTKLISVEARKTAADDPLMALARLVDGEARAVRKQYEEQVEEVVKQSQGAIAAKRF